MSTAHPWRSLALAFACASCGCTTADDPARTARAGGVEASHQPLRFDGMAPNGRPYPKQVECRSQRAFVSIYAGDLAKLAIVGKSNAADDATPLAHYRSAATDLEQKTIAELKRLHGAGLIRCHSEDCGADEACGLFVTAIHPNTPDGHADGSVMPPNPDVPKRWTPSADYRQCTYASSDAGPAATGVQILTVGCSGCGGREKQ